MKWRLDLQQNWEKTLLYIDWNIVIFNYIEYQSNTLTIFSNPSFSRAATSEHVLAAWAWQRWSPINPQIYRWINPNAPPLFPFKLAAPSTVSAGEVEAKRESGDEFFYLNLLHIIHVISQDNAAGQQGVNRDKYTSDTLQRAKWCGSSGWM